MSYYQGNCYRKINQNENCDKFQKIINNYISCEASKSSKFMDRNVLNGHVQGCQNKNIIISLLPHHNYISY